MSDSVAPEAGMVESWAGRVLRAHPVTVDVLLAIFFLFWWTISISLATEFDARPLDEFAYALGFIMTGAMLFRRQYPRAVLLTVFSLTWLYHAMQYPATGYLALVLMIPMYTTVIAGKRITAVAVTVVAAVGEVTWRVWGDSHAPLEVFRDIVPTIALMTAMILLAEVVRTRRAWVAEVQQRTAREARERERAFQRRVEDERLGIARDLHDVLAHTISVITVQAGAAADGLDPDDPSHAPTASALQTIRQSSRDAMAELRATVGVLREGTVGADPAPETPGAGGATGAERPAAPAPGLGDLPRLVRTVEDRGVTVEIEAHATNVALAPAVELTAYRIVQEALTNVVRHSPAEHAVLSIRMDDSDLLVSVVDDGTGGRTPQAAMPGARNREPAGSGYGIIGMRERVAALGGSFTAGPHKGGGFVVEARLPVPHLRPSHLMETS